MGGANGRDEVWPDESRDLSTSYASIVFAEVAALYVIVRGLDNMHKGVTGKAKEEWDRIYFGRRV